MTGAMAPAGSAGVAGSAGLAGAAGGIARAGAADDLSLTFTALADPTRRAILTRLAAGEATVGQLAEPFALTQQAISKHLKVLERAGLITRSKAAQSRPCRLEPGRFDLAADWIGQQRQIWRERYERLDDYIENLRSAGEEPPT